MGVTERWEERQKKSSQGLTQGAGGAWVKPPVEGAFWDGQGWDMPVKDKGLFGGALSGSQVTAKLLGSDRAASFLDPVGTAATRDANEGNNVFESLQRTMGESQEDITKGMKTAGTALGEGDKPDGFFGGLAGCGENLTKAENKNLGAQSTAHQQVNKGNVSQGLATGAQGQKEFFENKNVQTAIAVAASMGAASMMAPYLASTLGISNAAASALANGIVNGGVQTMRTGDLGQGLKTGLASGLGGYAASYVPSLGNAALTGAAKGAAQSGVSQLVASGKIDANKLASSAVGGGLSSGLSGYGKGVSGLLSGAATGAISGGSDGAQRGAIAGLLSGFGGQYGGALGQTIGNLAARNINQQNQKTPQRPVNNQNAGNNNGYNRQQLQQLYAQYMAQKRG